MPILTRRSVAAQRREIAHARRQLARIRGVDPAVVIATADDDLEHLLRSTPDPVLVEDAERYADGPDERASTLFFLASVRGESPPAPTFGLLGGDAA